MVYQRDTKDYMTERVPGGASLQLLYGSPLGRLALHTLIRRKVYSGAMGRICEMKLSRRSIPRFVRNFDIDLDEACCTADEYRSFNDFFTRELQPGARDFARDEELLLSPGDGRLRAWQGVDPSHLVQVKGMEYSLAELLQNDQLAAAYEGGTCLLLRLAPVDYHRFHFIADGVCTESLEIRGVYYSVNMIALKRRVRIFCQNRRSYAVQHSPEWGDILYIEVGATAVGSIIQSYTPGQLMRRGDEKGYFKFGGSTILLFFERDRVVIDDDILKQSAMDLEVRVLAGEPIGSLRHMM
ncbi:MAG: phosphatidylserine decarboxylase [Syntrophomonadaceae bacterium]|nr:phosphatidylserine decarboxylase [Syntrophomonadaceae bacterium]